MMKRFHAFTQEAFGDLTATGRVWMWVGLITLACSMGMAFDYGQQVSFKHGLVMALLSLCTAFILEEAYKFGCKGHKFVAFGFAVVAIPMFWQETKSHIAYTAGFRGINVETSELQETKYKDKRDDVEETKANLALYERRLAALQEANPWAASVTADQLRAKLASANLAIEVEASKGGCKVNCLKRTQERDDLQSRANAIDEMNRYVRMVDDTKAALQKTRDKAAAVEHAPSIVQHQNTTLFKLASLISNGNVNASPLLKEVVEQENTIGLALMPVLLPAFAFFTMGLYRRDSHTFEPAARSYTPTTMNPPSGPSALRFAGTTGPARIAA